MVEWARSPGEVFWCVLHLFNRGIALPVCTHRFLNTVTDAPPKVPRNIAKMGCNCGLSRIRMFTITSWRRMWSCGLVYHCWLKASDSRTPNGGEGLLTTAWGQRSNEHRISYNLWFSECRPFFASNEERKQSNWKYSAYTALFLSALPNGTQWENFQMHTSFINTCLS